MAAFPKDFYETRDAYQDDPEPYTSDDSEYPGHNVMQHEFRSQAGYEDDCEDTNMQLAVAIEPKHDTFTSDCVRFPDTKPIVDLVNIVSELPGFASCVEEIETLANQFYDERFTAESNMYRTQDGAEIKQHETNKNVVGEPLGKLPSLSTGVRLIQISAGKYDNVRIKAAHTEQLKKSWKDRKEAESQRLTTLATLNGVLQENASSKDELDRLGDFIMLAEAEVQSLVRTAVSMAHWCYS